VPQLTGRTLCPLSPTTGQVFGLFWLLACIGLLVAAGLHLAQRESWAIWALVSIGLSQLLIMLAWHDAKFGTLANLLIVVPALSILAHAHFQREVVSEIRALLSSVPQTAAAPVQSEELERLPVPVQRWLERAGVVGQPRARTVRLKQQGGLRTSPDAAFMPAQAEQYFALDDPAFIWRVDATMFGFLPFAGRDSYADGRGHMLIKAASLLNVVDAHDERIAHGALLRLLGEMIWFPSTALSPLLEWRAIDAASAEVTLRHAGLVATATYLFDDQARVTGMHAQRYLGGGPDAKLTPWVASCNAWSRMDGIEVPTAGTVSWELPAGLFTYYRWTLVDLQFDRRGLYGEQP
ncbi:MAG TPA: DUF6544 family protein, partial [Polyangiaceae bacterium]|nr:DUF6544 family protein [Polyangiaceae bacterium]